jgi:phospholipid-binding lipoprotein MlaA
MKTVIRNTSPASCLVIALTVVLAGCATAPVDESSFTPPRRQFPELVNRPVDSNAIVGVYDPFEKFNRKMYNFNTQFDRYVFLPVVAGYKAITPDIAEQGVSNFFTNLGEITSFMNNVLQGNVADSGATLSRFVINSTIGVFGLWDPATKMGITRRPEDFGETLGHWGVGAGPYLVLPILGPSNLRDTTGLAVDYTVLTSAEDAALDDSPSKNEIELGLTLLNAVDVRANTNFRYYETGSPFEYSLIRYLYREKRRFDIQTVLKKERQKANQKPN